MSKGLKVFFNSAYNNVFWEINKGGGELRGRDIKLVLTCLYKREIEGDLNRIYGRWRWLIRPTGLFKKLSLRGDPMDRRGNLFRYFGAGTHRNIKKLTIFYEAFNLFPELTASIFI